MHCVNRQKGVEKKLGQRWTPQKQRLYVLLADGNCTSVQHWRPDTHLSYGDIFDVLNKHHLLEGPLLLVDLLFLFGGRGGAPSLWKENTHTQMSYFILLLWFTAVRSKCASSLRDRKGKNNTPPLPNCLDIL